MTYDYRAPDVLERGWRRGHRHDPDTEMREAFRSDVEVLRMMVGSGQPLVPVQGRVSDMKSWMAACLADELSSDGVDVVVFAPQTTNRESMVNKLERYGSEYLEHPSRIDLCIWDDWRDRVGYVDAATCSEIPCPFYLTDDDEVLARTRRAVQAHMMGNDMEVGLDTASMREAGARDRENFCPAQLYLKARRLEETNGAVNAATYAKAFADAAVSDDDPLRSDVAILDEAHTVSMDADRVMDAVEPGALRAAMDEVLDYLDSVPQHWADRAMDDLADLSGALGDWLRRSDDEHTSPSTLLRGYPSDLSDCFDALDRADARITQRIRSRLGRGNWENIDDHAGPHRAAERLRGFLSRVHLFREGEMDFVHSIYQEGGSTVNEMGFRRLDGAVTIEEGTSPGAVFRAWREDGTHPAIADRWGPILDRHIEALWDGRAVFTNRAVPGAPITPMEEIRRITGATTLVTLSATHNELSDPTRDRGDPRETRHDIVCAPLYLRASGCDRDSFAGKRSVSPDTPWFRRMVEEAAERSGESLAAVPINGRSMAKWSGLPVTPLPTEDGELNGIVPNSRGSIGEKDLESLDVDTVACGVQAQPPASTARRLMMTWEMLAPRTDDPREVLDTSWRLLAQHVVSGTIQAGGRFDWDATNLLFERPGLVELAGFEYGVAGPDSGGFAGELCSLLEEAEERWARERDAVRARSAVSSLERAPRKKPTTTQTVGHLRRAYGDGAERGVKLALLDGRISTRVEDGEVIHET